MIVTIPILLAPKFKKLDKWLKKFRGKELCEGVAIFEDEGLGRTFVFVGERLRASILALRVVESSNIKLLVFRDCDRRKIYSDLLPRLSKFYALALHYPTARQCPTILIPSNEAEKLHRTERVSLHMLCRDHEEMFVEPLRRVDVENLMKYVMLYVRRDLYATALSKAGIDPETFVARWRDTLCIDSKSF